MKDKALKGKKDKKYKKSENGQIGKNKQPN